VTSSMEEAETLRKENDTLKTSVADKEERAKSVLKNARQKIMQLTEAKNVLSRQLTEVQNIKDENAMQMKSHFENQISHLEKENADLRAEKQQEKERMLREIEMLNQRLNQMQRQLDKQQGSKPSTSSGPVEKLNVEPPTANIKPMAGQSSIQSKQQNLQQSVITPWTGRGETPFASIRPMSMQFRTVAVLPTSQTSSSTGSQIPTSWCTQTGSASGAGAEGLSSSPTSSHTDYMPATSSAGSSMGSIRQVAVQPTQQATVTTITVGPSPSSREEPPLSAAESTQDIEAESGDMEVQPIAVISLQQQQHNSSRCNNSSNNSKVTKLLNWLCHEMGTTEINTDCSGAGTGECRTQEGRGNLKGDSRSSRSEDKSSSAPQTKRPRGTQEMFQPVPSESGVDVEYQVPTSSQRDHEDEVIVVDSEDDDEEGMADDGVNDGPEFEEETDNGESYEVEGYDRDEQDLTPYDEGEGPDIDEETPPDQVNNEVDIIEDSSEVPNQSERSIVGNVDNSTVQSAASSATVPVVSSAEMLHPPQQQRSEATSSGSASQAESGNVSGVVTSQASPSTATSFTRGRHIPPLCSNSRQQQLLLQPQYEEGDDSIVPSTPTLFVPRRTDGFGEAVSSPQVPTGRFTFSDTNQPQHVQEPSRVAQVASEGMDDTRMDLTQLEESGTGRSVPTTPLQVSPQGEIGAAEMSGEVGQSGEQSQQEAQPEGSTSSIPAITVTEAPEEGVRVEDDMPPPLLAETDESGEPRESTEDQAVEQEDMLELADEGGDGVSSEGEKPQAVEEMEEGREAEASESSSSQSERRVRGGTARRSARSAFRNRGHMPMRTPIVWNEPGSTSPRGRAMLVRGGPSDAQRGSFPRGLQRGRRMRGKPKGNFPPYQMRF
ncbi:hypothetical protein L9F63_005265, partial [Diploptera punctata]